MLFIDNSILFQNIPHDVTQDIQLNLVFAIKPDSTKCTIIKIMWKKTKKSKRLWNILVFSTSLPH